MASIQILRFETSNSSWAVAAHSSCRKYTVTPGAGSSSVVRPSLPFSSLLSEWPLLSSASVHYFLSLCRRTEPRSYVLVTSLSAATMLPPSVLLGPDSHKNSSLLLLPFVCLARAAKVAAPGLLNYSWSGLHCRLPTGCCLHCLLPPDRWQHRSPGLDHSWLRAGGQRHRKVAFAQSMSAFEEFSPLWINCWECRSSLFSWFV